MKKINGLLLSLFIISGSLLSGCSEPVVNDVPTSSGVEPYYGAEDDVPTSSGVEPYEAPDDVPTSSGVK